MENWAALVEKEAHTAKIWSMNWGEVSQYQYFISSARH
jgi:hypothetical protein